MSDRMPIVDYDGGSPQSTEGAPRYTELLGGSVPCPSCQGSGQVPKELEGQLVAIIPMNDKRLHPTRTGRYVAIVACFLVLLLALLLFFLLARSVDIDQVDDEVIRPHYVDSTDQHTNVNFMAPAAVKNSNFYGIRVHNSSVTIYVEDLWGSLTQIGSGKNASYADVAMRSNATIVANSTLALDAKNFPYHVFSCHDYGWIWIVIDYSIMYDFLSRSEQTWSRNKMKLCCSNHANETSYCPTHAGGGSHVFGVPLHSVQLN